MGASRPQLLGAGAWVGVAVLAMAVGLASRFALPILWSRVGAQFGFVWGGAVSLARGDGFVDAWSGEPLHYYPPLQSVLYAGVIVAGGGMQEAKILGVALDFAAVVVAFVCTRDLYGARAGALVAIVLSLDKFLIDQDGLYQPEGIVHALYTVTIWALVKSLTRPRMVLLAGAASGLLFLTKSSLGVFVLAAALAGLWWRVWYRGWRATLTDRPYIAAAGLFALLALPWIARNVYLFGWRGVDTQPHATESLAALISSSTALATIGETTLLFAIRALLILIPLVPLSLVLRRRNLTEMRALLWVAFGVSFGSAVMMGAGFRTVEGIPFWDPDNAIVRYTIPSLTPLAWIIFEHVDQDAATRRHLAMGALALAVILFASSNPLWVLHPAPNGYEPALAYDAVLVLPPEHTPIPVEAGVRVVPPGASADAFLLLDERPCPTGSAEVASSRIASARWMRVCEIFEQGPVAVVGLRGNEDGAGRAP